MTEAAGPFGGTARPLVGNDVVDLADPETRLDDLHPRFALRVFSDTERRALAASPDRGRLHWALWAAKEAAYKALRQLDPALVFSPRLLEVDLDSRQAPWPAAGSEGRLSGRVRHAVHGVELALELRVEAESLHAVATPAPPAAGTPAARIVSGLAVTAEEPSAAARRLARREAAAALSLPPRELRIAGRPPLLFHRRQSLPIGLSLSHHGRFVAFACALGMGELR